MAKMRICIAWRESIKVSKRKIQMAHQDPEVSQVPAVFREITESFMKDKIRGEMSRKKSRSKKKWSSVLLNQI